MSFIQNWCLAFSSKIKSRPLSLSRDFLLESPFSFAAASYAISILKTALLIIASGFDFGFPGKSETIPVNLTTANAITANTRNKYKKIIFFILSFSYVNQSMSIPEFSLLLFLLQLLSHLLVSFYC